MHVLDGPARPEQVADMLQALRDYIKVAVDIEREVVAGGGVMHADCAQALLESGSRQKDVWGGDWIPESARVRFTSLINVRPTQGNRSTEVTDLRTRERMEQIIRRLFTGS
jgi:hypothetical protein